MDYSHYEIPNETPVIFLDCNEAFSNLLDKERLYAHHLIQASWYGGLICLFQTSPESPGLFLIFQKVFRQQTPADIRALAASISLSEHEIDAFFIYIAAFYGNLGNYKSFGDTKFVPALPVDKFEKVIQSTTAYKGCAGVRNMWNLVKEPLYSLKSRVLQLGLGEDHGITTYFSSNCDKQDAEIIQKFLDQQKISPYNTRLFKTVDDGKIEYSIRQASLVVGKTISSTLENGSHVVVEQGDYSELFAFLIQELNKAREASLNETENNMLACYLDSFSKGSIDAHKDGSRFWIKDVGPVVENYMGFIESYRDPFGTRGEFESFVAVVNKEMSVKFQGLVNQSTSILPLLPWPSSYEKDKFLKPDFTSLDVITFASSGVPLGINIPNYDDIRQNEGFKNVSLGNVLTSKFKDKNITFLTDADKELYLSYIGKAYEVQVGLHELLGHGSGKLFKKEADGSFNFPSDTEDIIKGGKITCCYEHCETWDSKFTSLASTYEECRAECVGLFLCVNSMVLSNFGHQNEDACKVVHTNWLQMCRAGLCSLEMYTVENCTWRQAHSQARFVILRVLLEAAQDFVKITEFTGSDGKPDLTISIDSSKIESVGIPAIRQFLLLLQYYKSTGNFTEGSTMYKRYSEVSEHFVNLRKVVMARKQPRQLTVQANTILNEDKSVQLKTYDNTSEGMIMSFIERYANFTEVENAVEKIWKRDLHHFQY